MNIQRCRYLNCIQAVSVEQNRFSTTLYLLVGRFFQHSF
jgi:hypothetical protein